MDKNISKDEMDPFGIQNDLLNDLAYIIAETCLYQNEHPVSSLKRTFDNIDETYMFLQGNLASEDLLRILGGRDIGVAEDPNLPGMIWSLLVYISTMCSIYDYDVESISQIMEDHQGWEYLACSGRHLCYEEPEVGARMINDFMNS